MTYCLMTEDGKIRLEIRCLLKDRPSNLGQFIRRVEQGKVVIVMAKGPGLDLLNRDGSLTVLHTKKGTATAIGLANSLKGKEKQKLETDWDATGTSTRHINWIATENL